MASIPSSADFRPPISETSPLISSKDWCWQQEQPLAAELERIIHPNLVSLIEEHGDESRTNIAGAAGDEDAHGKSVLGADDSSISLREQMRGRAARRDVF